MIRHGFDLDGNCICNDPAELHVFRRRTAWARLRDLVHRRTGLWCPHMERVPTLAVSHPAHGSDNKVGPSVDVLFCLNCWATELNPPGEGCLAPVSQNTKV